MEDATKEAAKNVSAAEAFIDNIKAENNFLTNNLRAIHRTVCPGQQAVDMRELVVQVLEAIK